MSRSGGERRVAGVDDVPGGVPAAYLEADGSLQAAISRRFATRGRGDGHRSACFASLLGIGEANASQGARAYFTVRRAPRDTRAAFNAVDARQICEASGRLGRSLHCHNSHYERVALKLKAREPDDRENLLANVNLLLLYLAKNDGSESEIF